MRKHVSPPTDENEMTVLLIRMKGTEATMRGGFEAVSAALSRLGPVTTLPVRHTNGQHALPAPARATEVLDEAHDDADGNGAPEPVASEPRRSSPRKPPKSPTVLADFDPGTGDMPLKTLLANFNSEGVTDRYLVIACWLCIHRKLTEFNVDHVYTCIKHMGWTTPDDPSAALRYLKKKQHLLQTKVGHYKIIHIGEREAEALLKGTS